MKASVAKECGYTYLGKMYGIYGYIALEEKTGSFDIHGTNWLRRRGLDFFIWIETRVYSPTGSFSVEIIKEL